MNFDFEMPEIDFSNFETIVLPDMDFDMDFDFDFENLNVFEDIVKNMGKDGKYEFRWKDNDHDIEINSKEEWEAFKKTKEFKTLKKKLTIDKEKMRKEFAENKEKMKKQLKISKSQIAKIDKQKIRAELEKAKVELKKLKLNINSEKNEFIIDGKKIKVKKRLEIKVPKAATFDLNTRHCKVKLPNTVAFGNVKYGAFNANNLTGSELIIDYSPVTISDLNACTLFLNNVTDAKIASVTNTNLNQNSSKVHVQKVNGAVNISSKFGELFIDSFNPNFGEFILNLSQSQATLILGDVPSKFKYQVDKVKLENKHTKKGVPTNNLVKVNGAYSSLVIK